MIASPAPLRRLWARLDRRGRWATFIIAGLCATALVADLLANHLPLVLRYQGRVHVLPCLVQPAALRQHNHDSLARTLAPGDFMIPTPIPFGPGEVMTGEPPLSPPSATHWLGTDLARHDVAARLIHGTRVALLVGLGAAGFYVALGTLLGLLAAHFRGAVDAAITRLTEIVMSIPAFFLVLAAVGLLERPGLGALIVVIGLTYWTRVARLVRAEAQRVYAQPYIDAARLLGYSAPRLMARHVLPNVAGIVLVSAAFGVASATPLEAALSFLGFGAPDDWASWGGLLRGAVSNLDAWWLVLAPGAAVALTTMSFTLLAESLRETLDPRQARHTEPRPLVAPPPTRGTTIEHG